MVYETCNSLICLKTAEETCFRLFYHPALKVSSLPAYPIREGWIFSQDDWRESTKISWDFHAFDRSWAAWAMQLEEKQEQWVCCCLSLQLTCPWPACQEALHCLVSTHVGKMSDEAVVCHETERPGNCFNSCQLFHYLRHGQASLHSFCRTWNLIPFLWLFTLARKASYKIQLHTLSWLLILLLVPCRLPLQRFRFFFHKKVKIRNMLLCFLF